ncbi:MAG TPA: TatD family hydrolase [Vitreimonas sp.]|nr:TatD family hydrolase [Vitreimonas sp.]
MIFDTHCHYNLPPLYPDWQQQWHKAQEHGVEKSVVIGTDFASSMVATEIAEQEQNLYAAIGIHPEVYQSKVEKNETGFESQLEDIHTDIKELSLLITGQKVMAVGEVGLDYYWVKPEHKAHTMTLQKEAFIAHIKLAQEHSKPLILHVRDKEIPEEPTADNAYWDVISLLKEHHDEKQPFILHCASGPLNYIRQALEMGAYIGLAGNVTYKNADHLRSIAKITPVERLLLETDAPFLAPQEFRGQPCEPWMIANTAEYVSEFLGVEKQVFANNAHLVFKNFLAR